ncbi:hypothetical protein H1R20_g7455, partial [Candolleomyces eurysporus]
MATDSALFEGLLDFEIASIGRTCQTWYKVFGEFKPGVRPLIALHGGPGVNSAYLEILTDVTDGRPGPLIIYDQVGTGRSTHLPEKMGDNEFWSVQLFIDELNNLLKKLEIKEYDLLGHSWGGMLAASHAVQGPPGLKHLILSSSPASIPLWIESQHTLRATLPQDTQDTMIKHEIEGTVQSKEYQAAVGVFYSRHLCVLDQLPGPIAEGFACIGQDPTVYMTMYGIPQRKDSKEFNITGSLKDWTIIDQIEKIQVPTLVTNGAQDEATDATVAPYVEKLPHGKWVKFENLDYDHDHYAVTEREATKEETTAPPEKETFQEEMYISAHLCRSSNKVLRPKMSDEIPIREGYIDFEVASTGQTYQTFYRYFGELRPGVRPLIALHGGPGVNCTYLEILTDVTKSHPGPLIVYDQIGNGRSTHLREKMGDTDFWTVQLFIDELNNLIKKLDITEYDLLGHSWGGMLASSFVAQGAPGLQKLVISSSPASMQLWIEAQEVWKAQLPKEVRETIEKHEKDGTTDSKEYEEAVGVYYSRHLCTLDPMPAPIASGFECIATDPTVYLTMNGPSEFTITGSLKTWSIIDQIEKITVPTLLTNGKYDEAADSVLAPYVEKLPNGKWVQFKKSSHMAHFEEREEFMKVLENFLYGDGVGKGYD